MIRDGSESCGQGLYPANQHNGGVGAAEEKVWGDGVDILVLMADQCDLKCQANPSQQYSKDTYSKSSSSGKKSSPPPPPPPKSSQKKFITAPLKGELVLVLALVMAL